MPTTRCTAKASYKKLPGLLELSDTHLQWTQDGRKAPSVRVANSDAMSLFCSKEGAAQVKMKLGLVNDDAGYNFTFTAPQAVAYSDRENFKREITIILSRNRSTNDAPPKIPQSAFTSAPTSNAPTPRPLPSTRAQSVSSDGRTPILAGNNPVNDFNLRKKVLLSNPELASLHRDLVISNQITEAEFWDGREHLLLAQLATEGQRRGRSGQLVDPRPQTTASGEHKIVMTPQLVHDIFEEYPVVAKAYNDNVPNKLTEESFWTRYFQSKLFNAHRASIRSSATQFVVKDDPIFDKYLEKDDDELEPRRQRDDEVDKYVDLGATREDHGETGNERDVTMQAGRQRGVLPLIRKFNDHSERLLNSALGDARAAKRRRLDIGDRDEAVDLDDLHDPETSSGILLEMQDRQRYFEGQMAAAVEAQRNSQKVDTKTILKEAKDNMSGWETNLAQLKIDRKAGDAALQSMTQNVAARLEIKTKKDDIPESLFRQMATCQTAANEFLRQFWSTVYPPPTELQTLSIATPAQRTNKAAKMAGYLSKTHEKVAALVRTAQLQGVDPNKVEMAMKPVLEAVDRALAVHRNPAPSRKATR